MPSCNMTCMASRKRILRSGVVGPDNIETESLAAARISNCVSVYVFCPSIRSRMGANPYVSLVFGRAETDQVRNLFNQRSNLLHC
jgi:hypothetical protein